MTSAIDDPSERIVVAGAGPHGLATTLHLLTAAPRLRDRLVVVDPTGEWLSAWAEQFARLHIAHLRSPAVHHPAPRAGLLMEHTSTHRLPTSGLPYGLPTTKTFARFCHDLIDRYDLAPLIVQGTIVDVDPRAGGDGDGSGAGGDGVDGGDRRDWCSVTLESGGECTTLSAARLVIACNPCRAHVPSWALDLDPSIDPSRVRPAGQVDLRIIGDLTDAHVVIVGAGLTAAHLACGAARRGARVTMVCRQPIRERSFDTDPGWLGPKELARFGAIEDPRERLTAARAARGGGTIPPWMLAELRALADAGSVTILEDAEITDVRPLDRAPLDPAPLDPSLSRRLDIEIDIDGSGFRSTRRGRNVVADHCWMATGTSPTIDAMPALDGVRERIPTIDGLPVPNADLSIGGLPIHVTGRLAIIGLGPAAGNLWGARQGARRITRAITGIDTETDEPAPQRDRRRTPVRHQRRLLHPRPRQSRPRHP